MELTFPFKNLAINNLIEVFGIDVIQSFANNQEDLAKWASENFTVSFYRDRIPSFENEVLQIIETTNQETIDEYFRILSSDLNHLKDLFAKEKVVEKIEEWNREKLKKFNDGLSVKEKEFLASSDRKMNHLQQYEGYEFEPVGLGLLLGLGNRTTKKVIKTNYNFYCIEDKIEFIDTSIAEPFFEFLQDEFTLLVNAAKKYGIPWQEGKIKAREIKYILKPILFCEGEIDIDLITKAGNLLGRQDLVNEFELRQRGSCNNLDKLWIQLTQDNWETVPQKKLLLYDCDTNRPDEDFGHISRRIIPKQKNIIQRGIENLFPDAFIEKAIAAKKEFVDVKKISGITRGLPYETNESIINKDEKRNFCNWAIENGRKEDFSQFSLIFDMLEQFLQR